MNTSEKGRLAEAAAENHLEKLGYAILARNYRARTGEIDLIARDGDTLVFVEVRSRAGSSFGTPAETIGFQKRRRIIRTALAYAQRRGLDCPMRFDVIALEAGKIEHIPGAFDAGGSC